MKGKEQLDACEQACLVIMRPLQALSDLQFTAPHCLSAYLQVVLENALSDLCNTVLPFQVPRNHYTPVTLSWSQCTTRRIG